MNIRKAKIEEANQIAPLLLLATEEVIYGFIEEKNADKAGKLMHHFTATPANQYSFENCWVAEENGQILGAVAVYDGANLNTLRKPIGKYVEGQLGVVFNPEDETQAGEIYIDSLGVRTDQQGKGIGAQMLQHLIKNYVEEEGKTLGLLVDKDNPLAKKLYLKLGFEVVGEKTLVGKELEHLQIG